MDIFELIPFIFIIIVSIIAKYHKDYNLACIVAALILFGIILAPATKRIFDQQRPHTTINVVATKDIDNCQGMPSIHTQIFAMLSTFIFLKYPKMNKLKLTMIILTSLIATQRLVFERHTFNQVLGGLIIGVCIGSIIYKISDLYPKHTFTILVITSAVLLVIYFIDCIEKQKRFHSKLKNKNIPKWLDNDLIPLLNKKKREASSFTTYLLCSCIPDVDTTTYYTWDMITKMMDAFLNQIKDKIPSLNLIVGIKSGGAFLACYISKKLNIPYTTIRVSHYPNTKTIKKLTEFYLKTARIKEEIDQDVKDMNILLVDDQTSTGSTIKVSKEHLLEKGAASVISYCVFANKKYLCDYESVTSVAYFLPWGTNA